MEYPDSFTQMQIPPNTYDVNIVHRDDPNVVYGNIEKRLIIDSRDRNYKNYPKASNYIVKLNEQFKNITSIELSRAQIPQSGYIINNNNNVIHFKEGDECYKLEIPIGDYTIHQLVSQITASFCSYDGLSNKYMVTYNKSTGKITFSTSGTVPFELNFKGSVHLDNTHAGFKRLYPPCSMGKLLGFEPEIYGLDSNVGVITEIKIPVNPDNQQTVNLNDVILCCCPAFSPINAAFIYMIKANISIENLNLCDFLYIYDNKGRKYVFYIVRKDPTINKIWAYLLKPKDGINTCNCNPECWEMDDSYPINSLISDNLIGTGKKYQYINSHITAPNRYDLFYNRYLVLHIKELERLRSKETSVMDSFAILPLNDKSNSLINVDASKYPTSKEIKYFTPPLGKLDRLTIQFLTYDGYEYDFNGLEHYLDLRINMLNQQGKYLSL